MTEPSAFTPTAGAAPSWWNSRSITPGDAVNWVAKARQRSLPVLALAGTGADPAAVVPYCVESTADGIFGNFMLAWLESGTSPRQVRHLPDGAFFLQLLRRVYAPVFAGRPDLEVLLDDTSRFEMSLTNDVLQIQLRTLEPGYSMIRHHALMLFFAALWLQEPQRTGWLDLYDQLLSHLDRSPGGRPGLAGIRAAEAAAFVHFARLAPLTLQPDTAAALLEDPDQLEDIIKYQLYAGAAIGLLWRQYRELREAEQLSWQREQLAGYLTMNYLERDWTDLTS